MKLGVEVPNVYVAFDIIMSFYGRTTNSGNLPDNKHLLESIKCNNFFGLNTEQILPDDLVVPSEDFELLLDVIDLIGYNDKTIQLINKNLPENYDMATFPKELLREMLNLINIDHIIFGNNHGYIIIYDWRTNESVHTFRAHTDCIRNICCSPDQKYIASASNDKTIKIWDAKDYRLLNTFVGHTHHVTSVCFSPDNKRLISGSLDMCIKIWDTEKYILLHTLTDHTNDILCVCYAPNNKSFASTSKDYIIKIWDAESFVLIKDITENDYITTTMCYSPDSKRMATGGWNRNIKIWDTTTYSLISTLVGHDSAIQSLHYSPNNKWLIPAVVIIVSKYGTLKRVNLLIL